MIDLYLNIDVVPLALLVMAALRLCRFLTKNEFCVRYFFVRDRLNSPYATLAARSPPCILLGR
jgi:hypothetical protein